MNFICQIGFHLILILYIYIKIIILVLLYKNYYIGIIIINYMDYIFFICNAHFFKNHHTSVRIDFLNNIKLNNSMYNINIYFDDECINNINNDIINLNPKLIIFFDINCFSDSLHKFDFVFSYNIPIYLFIEDTYYILTTTSCHYVKKSNGLIIWYKNQSIINSYKRFLPDKNITNINTRFVNIDIYKDYKLEKKYDILIYGSRECCLPYKKQDIDSIQNYIKKYETINNTIVTNETLINFYSLRLRLLNLLENNSHKYNLKICPVQGDYVYNEELSKLINESYLTIACSSIVDVMLFKHLEISASKSVILGSYPSDYKDLFEGNIIEVNEFMNDDEILNIIDNALSNKDKLFEMSERLYNKIREEHNLHKAQESFNEVIKDILKIHYL